MISNLSHQLKDQGALDRMNEVLEEIPRVRKDMGYPPLVTPSSQIVGTQAVMNVITGERYKSITNEVKLYMQGRYGKAPGKIDEKIRKKAIGNDEVITCRPADKLAPELDKLKKEIGELATSEEDVLTYAMFPEIGRQFLDDRANGILQAEALLPVSNGETGGHLAPTEFNVTMHGETYHIKVTGAGQKYDEQRPFYLSVDGVPEEVLIESLEEIEATSTQSGNGSKQTGNKSGRTRATKPGHVTSSMPGTIVEIMVKVGDAIKDGDPVLVVEAMKMENEVPAPVSGTVKAINVSKGDSVNPDEALVEIE